MNDRAWVEINLENLNHNIKVLNATLPEGCQLMAVVKANGYGHGAEGIARQLEKLGVTAFAVATIDEGIALRQAGVRSEILILGYTDPHRACELSGFDLTQTIVGYEHALGLEREGYHIKVHIKIDTGMHRLGFDCFDLDKVAACFSLHFLHVGGIFSHLCVSDSLDTQDVEFTHIQISRFYNLLEELSAKGIDIPKTHLQSSYGLLNYPELKCNFVRTGVALYGVHSSQDIQTKLQLDLRPVLSLKSRIVQIRTVSAGEAVGYGRRYITQKDTRLAIVPIGYADGIPRALSCKDFCVLIKGTLVPIVGRICMDQLAIDVSTVPDVAIGDEVTLIGQDGKREIKAVELAEETRSITNEILSRIGRRLRIVMK